MPITYNAVVTGGGGFLGRKLMKVLQNQGYRCISLDNFSSPNSRRAVHETAKDVRQIDQHLRGIVEQDAVVYHLASHVDVQQSVVAPMRTVSDITSADLSVINYCSENHLKLVYVSTCMVVDSYGNINPRSPYAAAKAFGDTLVSSMVGHGLLRGCVIRPSNIYGPGQRIGLLPAIFRAAMSGRAMLVYGDGNQERNMSYVADVAKIIALEQCKDESPVMTTIMPPVKERHMTVNEIIQESAQYLEREVLVAYSENPHAYAERLVEPRRYATNALEIETTTKLADGLWRTFAWLKKITTSARRA